MTVFFTQKGSKVMIERIQLILKSLNLSPTRLADEIDVQRSGVSHILSGRNKPSLDFVMKILSTYPEINSDWLMFGKGKMFNVSSKKVSLPEEEKEKPKIESEETNKESYKVSSESPAPYGRKIEKIVVFYSDNTFREFLQA
jgi:transcriptional regulator with XRE-family HTH domain